MFCAFHCQYLVFLQPPSTPGPATPLCTTHALEETTSSPRRSCTSVFPCKRTVHAWFLPRTPQPAVPGTWCRWHVGRCQTSWNLSDVNPPQRHRAQVRDNHNNTCSRCRTHNEAETGATIDVDGKPPVRNGDGGFISTGRMWLLQSSINNHLLGSELVSSCLSSICS